MDTEAPSTVWLLWTLLLETLGCRCFRISLHLYLWGKSPAVQLLGRRAGLFLTLWGPSTQFSRVAAPDHIPTYIVRRFPFLRILCNICGFLPCSFSPCSLVWGGISLWFWFVFPWWQVMQSIFPFSHVLVGHVYVFFGEISVHVFCPFHDWIVCFFGVDFMNFL